MYATEQPCDLQPPMPPVRHVSIDPAEPVTGCPPLCCGIGSHTNRLVMASNLVAMASSLLAMAPEPTSDGLQATSDGLQPTSDGLQILLGRLPLSFTEHPFARHRPPFMVERVAPSVRRGRLSSSLPLRYHLQSQAMG